MAFVINVSKTYKLGYYYVFPNKACDVQGFGDGNATPQRFREVLDHMGCPDLKPKGAFIPRSCDYPLHDHIILIGDAGGFPHRLTAEGLYYASARLAMLPKPSPAGDRSPRLTARCSPTRSGKSGRAVSSIAGAGSGCYDSSATTSPVS